MNPVISAVRAYGHRLAEGWNTFWFTAADPATLAAIRMCAGAMLFYTHLVWSLDLQAFFGPDGWLPPDLMAQLQEGRYAWSHFWVIESPAIMWTVHLFGLAVFGCLTIGFHSRVMSVLAYVIAVSYVNRIVPGAFFGLDKINCMLAMYLIIGPCGACYSLDRWLARRRAGGYLDRPIPSVGANIAVRMIQLHMCVIYLFAGLEKLQGVHWWDGTAVWMSVANAEYQTVDLTGLAHYPMLVALLTHLTVFWELFYCAVIWHPLTRPITLLGAVCVHGGIALGLGMITFGLAMLIGNMAFLPPWLVRAAVDRPLGWVTRGRAGESGGVAAASVP